MRTRNLIANDARSRRHEDVAARQRYAQQSEPRFRFIDYAVQRDGGFLGGRLALTPGPSTTTLN